MTEIEKKIDKAAEQYIGGPFDVMEYEEKVSYRAFKNGVNSSVAKEFHQQGMFTEQDLKEAFEAGRHQTYDEYWDQKYKNTYCNFEAWFDKNKKK